jgi:triosephosphate isomerase
MAEHTRKPLISGNWKMHQNHYEAIRTVQKLSYRLAPADYDAVEVSVHPPFTALRSVQTVLDADDIPIALGAQNCHWESAGAFTGEVSPSMLAKLGVRYVIIGHSERRQLFGETDEVVVKKLRGVLQAGMSPIVCVGETLAERDAGATLDRISAQLSPVLAELNYEELPRLVVAYEPVWAIGTGRTASPADAQEVCAAIRGQVAASFQERAGLVRIQYGGSVRPDNSAQILSQPDVDGALVGGASLDPDQFAQIVHARGR